MQSAFVQFVIGLAIWTGLAVRTTSALADAPAAYQAGQSIEVREGDTWSAATIVRHEGRKYLIHYSGADSSADEWVAIDRMRSAGSAPAPAAPPKTLIPSATKQDKDGLPDEVIPQIEPRRTNVDVPVLVDAPPAWSVAPDVIAKVPTEHSFRLLTESADKDMHVQQLLPCLGGGAVVGFGNMFEKSRRIERVGAIKGPMRAVIPPQCLPLAASPSGEMLVCRCNKFGFGNNSRIDVFTLANGTATPLVSFTPYPADKDNKKAEDIRFAAAVSETRIVTCDSKGRIIAWDIASNSATGAWRVDVGTMHFGSFGQNIALGPTEKWLAAAGNAGITFVDTSTGQVLGLIPSSPDERIHDLSVSPAGKTLVARMADDNLVSFDIGAGERARIVALPPRMFGALACVNYGFVLINAKTLVDARTGGAVSKYLPMDGAALAVTGPGVTFVAANNRVWAGAVPDASIRAAAEAAEEAALLLKPGMSVAVDIQVDMSITDKVAVDAAGKIQKGRESF